MTRGTGRFIVAAGVTVGLVLGAGGCRSTKEPREQQYDVGRGDAYVALGDSYTAASKTGPVDGRDGCGRSRSNYPHRIAAATGVELADVSCNGASTTNLTSEQDVFFSVHPPQLDAVDEDTDLVTIRLGANDYLLFARIIRCAGLGWADRPGTPCADLDAEQGANSVDNRLDDLRGNLDRALAEIKDRAPGARIIAIGYPQVIPAAGTCEDVPLPAGDYPWARGIVDGLNEALEGAATAAGVTYIDLYPASEGHDICAEEPWIAGADPAPTGATPWHTYAAEGQAVAELVLAELES